MLKLALGPVLTWDPQRLASRDDIAFAGRVFARTLTTYAPNTDPDDQDRLVGDLATDTGTSSEDLKTWSFTLRDGVLWQDGTIVDLTAQGWRGCCALAINERGPIVGVGATESGEFRPVLWQDGVMRELTAA